MKKETIEFPIFDKAIEEVLILKILFHLKLIQTKFLFFINTQEKKNNVIFI